jgi:phage gp29-like protein
LWASVVDTIELGQWTAPDGYRIASLERPRPLPAQPPRGRDARDLRYYDSWIPHPGTGLTPGGLVAAMRQAEQGYPQLQVDLFDDIVEGDAHLRNLFEHRERVVAKAPLVINPGSPDKEAQLAASVLSYALSLLPLKAAFEHLLRVNRYGYAGVELDWDVVDVDGRPWIVPVHLSLVPARRFRIGVMGMIPVKGEEDEVRLDELRLYKVLEVPQGHPLNPGKWLQLKRQPSQVARGGLMRTAAPLAMGKRFSFRDWLILCERYGLPFPVLQYDGEASDQATLDLMRDILRRIGSDGGAAVAKAIDFKIEKGIDVKDALQASFIAFANNEMSKLINGSTLRNDNAAGGTGSYGLGDVHNQVAWDEVRGDGEMLAEAIDGQICVPFTVFNNIARRNPPRAQIMVEPDLGPMEFMDLAVKHVNELGGKASLVQVHQRTGLRMPLTKEDEAPGMTVEKFPAPAGGTPK